MTLYHVLKSDMHPIFITGFQQLTAEHQFTNDVGTSIAAHANPIAQGRDALRPEFAVERLLFWTQTDAVVVTAVVMLFDSPQSDGRREGGDFPSIMSRGCSRNAASRAA